MIYFVLSYFGMFTTSIGSSLSLLYMLKFIVDGMVACSGGIMVFLLLEIPSLGLSLIFKNMGYRVVSFSNGLYNNWLYYLNSRFSSFFFTTNYFTKFRVFKKIKKTNG
jgi:hypothetical protein